jgi:antirestriction protein ArdC
MSSAIEWAPRLEGVELIAEISSAFVCASLDIVPTVPHADYVGSWLEVLGPPSRTRQRRIVADASPRAGIFAAHSARSPQLAERLSGVSVSIIVRVKL